MLSFQWGQRMAAVKNHEKLIHENRRCDAVKCRRHADLQEVRHYQTVDDQTQYTGRELIRAAGRVKACPHWRL